MKREREVNQGKYPTVVHPLSVSLSPMCSVTKQREAEALILPTVVGLFFVSACVPEAFFPLSTFTFSFLCAFIRMAGIVCGSVRGACISNHFFFSFERLLYWSAVRSVHLSNIFLGGFFFCVEVEKDVYAVWFIFSTFPSFGKAAEIQRGFRVRPHQLFSFFFDLPTHP